MGEEPEKLFHCNYRGCTFSGVDEASVNSHIREAHPKWKGDVAKMYVSKAGNEMETIPKVVEQGFLLEDQTKAPLDMWSSLRRILQNVGVRKNRDTIIELFQMEKDPTNYDMLMQVMSMADVAPGTIDLTIALWKKYIERGPFGMDLFEDGKEVSPVFGKSKATPKKNMADFDADDWARWLSETQKTMMGNMMQMKMMEFMMGMFGNSGTYGQKKEEAAKLPSDVEAALKELQEIKAAQRMRETIDPILREVRQYRDQVDEAKRTGKSPIIAELMEWAAMSKAFDSMGSREAAEVASQKAQSKLEELRIQSEERTRQMQLQLESQKQEQNRLQLEKMQAEFNKEVALLRKDNEIAAQSKAQDLVTVIKQAQEVQTALKQIGGETQETADERKLQIIGDTVTDVMDGLKPVLQTALSSRQGSPSGPRPQAAMPNMPQGQGYVPPPQAGTDTVWVRCLNETCAKEFPVDATRLDRKKPQVTCPGCGTLYELNPLPPAQVQAPLGPPIDMSRPPRSPPATTASNDARRRELMALPPDQFEDFARQMGVEPSAYHDKGALVDDLLRAAYGGK